MWQQAGPENTNETLEIAVKRAKADGLPLVIAPTPVQLCTLPWNWEQILSRWFASPTMSASGDRESMKCRNLTGRSCWSKG